MSLVYSSTGQSNPLRLFEMSFCFGSGDTFGGSRLRFTVNIDVSWLHIHLRRELAYLGDAAALRFLGRLFCGNGEVLILLIAGAAAAVKPGGALRTNQSSQF